MHIGNKTLGWAAAVLAITAAGGCASMSGDECRLADWHAVGFEDGARGYSAEAMSRHRQACAEHGVAPDFQAYQSGRSAGLAEFCQPAKGFRAGADGSRYAGVCPPELEAAFLPAYQDGRRLHDLQAGISAIDGQIRNTQHKIKQLKSQRSEKEDQVIADGKSREERVLLLKEIWELSREQGDLEDQIKALQQERALRKQDLERYREEVAYLY